MINEFKSLYFSNVRKNLSENDLYQIKTPYCPICCNTLVNIHVSSGIHGNTIYKTVPCQCVKKEVK